jgi:DNA-binding response OmpR family regulator
MKTPIKILYIEDDPDDVELLEDSLKDYNVHYEMYVINDGGLVSNYLLGDTQLPDTIVLDLNLPRIHGREILKK